MRKFICVVLMVLGCSAVGAEDAQRVLLDGVAAHVGKNVVTVGEVLGAMAPVQRQLIARLKGDELKKELVEVYESTLRVLIDRRLILDAYDNLEMRIPDWVVEKRVNEVVHDSFGGDREALMDALARDKVTLVEWRERLYEQLVVSVMRNSHVTSSVRVEPSAARAYYDSHPEEFVRTEKVKVRMLLVDKGDDSASRVAARGRIDAAMNRVRDGEAFADVAREVSDGSKADAGGDWGWMEPAVVLRKELARVLADLPAGGVSPVLDVAGAFYIVKVDDRQEASAKPFESVQLEIEQALREKEGERIYTRWIERLEDESYVKIFDVDLF